MGNDRESSPRTVIARYANGGIGDHLSCLIGAWWYARRTGRTLIIDWRGSRFNTDPDRQRNCFVDMFGYHETLAGVRVVCDERVDTWVWEGPYYPTKWNARNLSAVDHVKHTASEIAQVNALVTSDEDRTEATVAFNQWIEPPPPVDAVRELLGSLQFAAPVREAANQIWAKQVGERQAVAIHIRHGNGENIGERAAYWLDPLRLFRQLRLNATADVHRVGEGGRFGDNMPESLVETERLRGSELSFLKRVAREANAMRRHMPGSALVLFCDSQTVVETFRTIVDDVVVPPKHFVVPSAGPLHAIKNGSRTGPDIGQMRFEMAVELDLMRRCTGLVCMDSGFSIFSKVLLDQKFKKILRPPAINRLIGKLIHRFASG